MNSEIVESFGSMVREKGIDKDMLVSIVQDVFAMMVKKKYGQDAKFDVTVNMEKGDNEIFVEREVLAVVENPSPQIDVKTARELSGEDLDVGEDYVEVVSLASFGRRLVVSAKQNLNQKDKQNSTLNDNPNANLSDRNHDATQVRKCNRVLKKKDH